MTDDVLVVTSETPLTPDPNFPSGYSNQGFTGQAFDFTSNRHYQAILGAGVGGIAVSDLDTMAVLQTVTMNQMYAGTSYGVPAGSPPSQEIHDLACGNGTDIYILTGASDVPHDEFCRFTRVDPATMKVTGDWFVSNGAPPPITCVMGKVGVVNGTTAHTIVAYLTNAALSSTGPMIMDGTGMAPIGMGPSPAYGNFLYYTAVIPGAERGDGTCDFLMLNCDSSGGTGNVDIWRINVSDSLAITSTKTGTANILGIFTPTPKLYIAQSNYDATHDAIILWLTTSTVTNGPPVWVVSVNYDGTINWSRSLPSTTAQAFSRGQSRLTGSTLMVGGGGDLTLLDTGTGAVVFTGTVDDVSGDFFRVYDASRLSYWTYGFGTVGFTRIDFRPPRLAMDNVVAVTEPDLERNLISLRWSDDRGHSYGSPVSQDIGAIGEYRTSLQWQRLGMCRDRSFEIFWSVPMPTALQGCWIDVTPAQS
jgi:hypothetical protein